MVPMLVLIFALFKSAEFYILSTQTRLFSWYIEFQLGISNGINFWLLVQLKQQLIDVVWLRECHYSSHQNSYYEVLIHMIIQSRMVIRLDVIKTVL